MSISVIIPVYNVLKYMIMSMESVIKQSYCDLEIIAVDDGSSDASSEYCDEIAVSDARIIVVHKENGGVSMARNSGLDLAMGDYFTFVDSDDYIDSNMYQDMIEIAKQYACDIVVCDCIKETETSHEVYSHNIRSGFYDVTALKQEYYPHLLMMENLEYPVTISNWTCFFKRAVCREVRYIEGVRYSEDLLYGATAMLHVSSFYYMKGEVYYHYRMNPLSATHKYVPDKWNDFKRLYQEAVNSFGCRDDFDFSDQLDKMLLFFLYNVINDTRKTFCLSSKEKKDRIYGFLNDADVRNMFKRIPIRKINISQKQKMLTYLFKYKIGIGLLCV